MTVHITKKAIAVAQGVSDASIQPQLAACKKNSKIPIEDEAFTAIAAAKALDGDEDPSDRGLYVTIDEVTCPQCLARWDAAVGGK